MRHLALATALLLAASTASAAFEYTRETTVRDDLGGRFQLSAAGTFGDGDSTRVAEGRYLGFHPRNEAGSVLDGAITREAVRDGDLVSVTYDGSITLTTTAAGSAPRATAIAFTDLAVERAPEEGVTITGALTVNGRTIDAADLPRPVKAILVRALRMFRL